MRILSRMVSHDLIYETLLDIKNTLNEMKKNHRVLTARVEGHEIVIVEAAEEIDNHDESLKRHSQILARAGLK